MTHVTTVPPIFVMTGPPGAGKSTVAVRPMQRFPRGVHIPLDDVREWVVAGRTDPVPTWTGETSRQFRVAREGAIRALHEQFRQQTDAEWPVIDTGTLTVECTVDQIVRRTGMQAAGGMDYSAHRLDSASTRVASNYADD